jgi:hypothetical protein
MSNQAGRQGGKPRGGHKTGCRAVRSGLCGWGASSLSCAASNTRSAGRASPEPDALPARISILGEPCALRGLWRDGPQGADWTLSSRRPLMAVRHAACELRGAQSSSRGPRNTDPRLQGRPGGPYVAAGPTAARSSRRCCTARTRGLNDASTAPRNLRRTRPSSASWCATSWTPLPSATSRTAPCSRVRGGGAGASPTGRRPGLCQRAGARQLRQRAGLRPLTGSDRRTGRPVFSCGASHLRGCGMARAHTRRAAPAAPHPQATCCPRSTARVRPPRFLSPPPTLA